MKLKTLFAVGLLAFSSTAFSTGVMKEMFQMKKELTTLSRAETAEQFQQSADAFIALSEKAKATMPMSLSDEQARFEGYQAGMQAVIDVVNKAKEQAKEGKLEEAKATIEVLDDMRKQYHKEYK